MIHQYILLCEQAHQEVETLTSSGKLAEQNLRNLKQEWNNARDKHNHTIKTWEDLAKKINHDTDNKICFDNYSLLKTIG